MPTYQTDGSGARQEVSLSEIAPAPAAPETPAAVVPATTEPPVASAPTDELPDQSDDLESLDLSTPPGRNKLQRRFDRLTGRLRDKDREIQELRSQQVAMMQLFAERQQPPTPEPAPSPSVPQADHEPRPEDFPTHEAFVRAVGRWEATQLFAERDRQQQARDQQQRQETAQSETAQRWQASRQAALQQHADFDDVLAQTDVRISPAAEAALLESDQAALLVYHLARHPEEAARLNALSPLAAAREVGKLEVALARPMPAPTPSPPVPPPRPQATPLQPVSQAGTPQATLPLDQMSYRDYQRARDRGQGA